MNIINNRLSKNEQTKVIALANCLLFDGWEYTFCTFMLAIEELNRFIDTIKGMRVDDDMYQVVDDNTILFKNGSKIYFNQWSYQ